MTPEQVQVAVSLKEYFEARLESLDKATILSEKILDARLHSMNEFRVQLEKQASSFLPRSEYVLMHEKLKDDVTALREFRVVVESKASQNSMLFVMGLSIVGLLIGVLGLFWRH